MLGVSSCGFRDGREKGKEGGAMGGSHGGGWRRLGSQNVQGDHRKEKKRERREKVRIFICFSRISFTMGHI